MISMDLSKIRFAKGAAEDVKLLEQKINSALEPTIKDLSLVEQVYEQFLSFLQWSGKVMDVNNRKKFLFIAVLPFS